LMVIRGDASGLMNQGNFDRRTHGGVRIGVMRPTR
jgi:hypothetical protein